jgi:hypothetical protein
MGEPDAQHAMVVAAVYSVLIESLPLYTSTVTTLEKHWDLDLAQVECLGIRPSPTDIVNVFASAECAERFGDRLVQVPGFFSYNRLPCVCASCECCQFRWSEDCICANKVWRIDLDPKLSRRGLIVPQRDLRGLIERLWIYRHTGDRRPFPLMIRREPIAA